MLIDFLEQPEVQPVSLRMFEIPLSPKLLFGIPDEFGYTVTNVKVTLSNGEIHLFSNGSNYFGKLESYYADFEKERAYQLMKCLAGLEEPIPFMTFVHNATLIRLPWNKEVTLLKEVYSL